MIDSLYDLPLELCNHTINNYYELLHIIDLSIHKSIRVGVVPRLETFDRIFLNQKVCEVFCSKDLQMLLIYMFDMSILKGKR